MENIEQTTPTVSNFVALFTRFAASFLPLIVYNISSFNETHYPARLSSYDPPSIYNNKKHVESDLRREEKDVFYHDKNMLHSNRRSQSIFEKVLSSNKVHSLSNVID